MFCIVIGVIVVIAYFLVGAITRYGRGEHPNTRRALANQNEAFRDPNRIGTDEFDLPLFWSLLYRLFTVAEWEADEEKYDMIAFIGPQNGPFTGNGIVIIGRAEEPEWGMATLVEDLHTPFGSASGSDDSRRIAGFQSAMKQFGATISRTRADGTPTYKTEPHRIDNIWTVKHPQLFRGNGAVVKDIMQSN